jgi:hypothetical protein
MTGHFSSIYRDYAKTNPTARQTTTKLYRRLLVFRPKSTYGDNLHIA